MEYRTQRIMTENQLTKHGHVSIITKPDDERYFIKLEREDNEVWYQPITLTELYHLRKCFEDMRLI